MLFRETGRFRTIAITLSVASQGASCSQKRRLNQPEFRQLSAVPASLFLLLSIFSNHHSRLQIGMSRCSEQACQKQPLTNTTSYFLWKAMSMAHPGSSGHPALDLIPRCQFVQPLPKCDFRHRPLGERPPFVWIHPGN